MTLKKYFPWLLAALLALALIWALSTQAVSLSDVGLIDMGRVLSESDYAQRLNSQLTAKYDQLVAQLQAAAESEEIDENEKAEQDRAIYAEYLRFRQELETQFQQALIGQLLKLPMRRTCSLSLMSIWSGTAVRISVMTSLNVWTKDIKPLKRENLYRWDNPIFFVPANTDLAKEVNSLQK